MDDRYGIGIRARYWRQARGRSQEQVARDVGRSRPGIALIEDQGIDSFTFLVDFCRSLNITVHQFFAAPVPGADLTPERLAELDDALGIDTENAPSVMIARTLGQKVHEDPVLVIIPGGGWQLMERRTALKHAGRATLIALGGGFPVVLNADDAKAVTHALRTQTINQQAVDAYRDLLAALRRAEDQLGSLPALLGATEIHLNTIQGWLGSYQPGSIRPQLTRLAAEYGQFAGWLACDGGNPARAIDFYTAAMERAQILGDRPLTAYILSRMALAEAGTPQAIRHGREAVQAADQTNIWQVRSLASNELARAHAQAGHAKLAIAAADRAVAECERAGDTPAPPYAYWYDESRLALWRGYALVHTGQHPEAQAALQTAAETMGAQFVRGRASAAVALTESHAAAGDRPEACRAGGQAVDLLRAGRSVRLTRRLRTVYRRLVSRGSSPDVRALGEQLQAL